MIRIFTEYSPDALERSLNELISSNPGSRIVGISSHYAQDVRDGRHGAAYAEYVAAVEVSDRVLQLGQVAVDAVELDRLRAAAAWAEKHCKSDA